MQLPEHLADIQTLSATELRAKYSLTYSSWRNMKSRAKRDGHFVHPDFQGFAGFLAAMGPRPSAKYTIDRFEVADTDYAPNKCRWLDKAGQANNRSSTRWLTIDGVEKPLTVWATETEQKADTVRHRLRNGASHKQALFQGKAIRKGAATSGFYWLPRTEAIRWEADYKLAVEGLEERITRYEYFVRRSRAEHSQLTADIERYRLGIAEGPTYHYASVDPKTHEKMMLLQIAKAEADQAKIAAAMQKASEAVNARK